MSETSPLVRLRLGQLCHHATYAYDANGNRTMFEEDSNGDGTVDSRVALHLLLAIAGPLPGLSDYRPQNTSGAVLGHG